MFSTRRARRPPLASPSRGDSRPTRTPGMDTTCGYYPMALLFLTFDMEMVFMYPWAVVFVKEGEEICIAVTV